MDLPVYALQLLDWYLDLHTGLICVPSTTDGQMGAYVTRHWNLSKVGRNVSAL